MRRFLAIIVFSCISVIVLFSSVIPVTGFDKDVYFKSPALLAYSNESSPIYFELKGYADSDFIGFLQSPALVLGKAADKLVAFLSSQTDDYIFQNFDSIKEIFSFDPNFPDKGTSAAESSFLLDTYLENNFKYLDAGNRARAAVNAINSSLDIFSGDTSKIVSGELDFSFRLGGYGINNGFGWNTGMAIVFDGSKSIIDTAGGDDRTNKNDLYMSIFSDFGYGLQIGDNAAIGISVSPSLIFRTGISNKDFISSRVDGNFIGLVMNNNFDFGIGFDINLGLLLKPSEDIQLIFDIRNLPSMQMYWYFSATDVMNGFQFHEDENIYFTPPDASLGLKWDREVFHISAELSDIASQLIWKAMMPSYDFDILSVPKISFTYDIALNMSIEAGYKYRKLYAEYKWLGLKAGIEASLDKLGFGIILGYEM